MQNKKTEEVSGDVGRRLRQNSCVQTTDLKKCYHKVYCKKLYKETSKLVEYSYPKTPVPIQRLL